MFVCCRQMKSLPTKLWIQWQIDGSFLSSRLPVWEYYNGCDNKTLKPQGNCIYVSNFMSGKGVVSNCFTQFYPIIHIHPTFVFCSFPSLAGTGTIRLQSNHRHVIAMHGIEYWQGSAMRYNIHIKSCDLWWNGSRSEWMRHDTLPHVGWSCSVSSVATAIETYVPVAQCFAVLRPSRHALHTD